MEATAPKEKTVWRVPLTEERVLRISNRDTIDTRRLSRLIRQNEELALFIVNHKTLAELRDSTPHEDPGYTFAHVAVRHPNVAKHVLYNLPEVQKIRSALGYKVKNMLWHYLRYEDRIQYYAEVEKVPVFQDIWRGLQSQPENVT